MRISGKSGDPLGYVERNLSIETYQNGRPRKGDFIIEKIHPETTMLAYDIEEMIKAAYANGRLTIDSLLYNLNEKGEEKNEI